jgi:hypothetical protein
VWNSADGQFGVGRPDFFVWGDRGRCTIWGSDSVGRPFVEAIAFADDVRAALHQIEQKIEDQRANYDPIGPLRELAPARTKTQSSKV